MTCQHKDTYHLRLPERVNPSPELDMRKVIYNTQGEIVGKTITQEYGRDFKEFCKKNSIRDRVKFVCPQTCDNKLSTFYLTDKIVK